MSSELFVSYRPICVPTGIAFNAQWERAKRDKIPHSTVRTVRTVGANGKQREMM